MSHQKTTKSTFGLFILILDVKKCQYYSFEGLVPFQLMFGLPRETHRYFIEPLTSRRHIKFDLIDRFLNFTSKIRKSKKETLIYVYEKILNNVRSITGKNLTKIMCDANYIDKSKPGNCSELKFRTIQIGEEWRINLVKELINVKHDTSTIENLDAEEIEEMMEYVCTTGPS